MSCPHVTKSELVGDEVYWCLACQRKDNKRLKAKVADLTARLQEVRKQSFNPNMRWARGRIQDVTNLRVRKWREL